MESCHQPTFMQNLKYFLNTVMPYSGKAHLPWVFNSFLLIISCTPIGEGWGPQGVCRELSFCFGSGSAAQYVLGSREAESNVRGRILAQKAHMLGAG